MPCLYLIGGQQMYLLPVLAEDRRLFEYHKGIIVKLNTGASTSKPVMEYSSPAEARAESGCMLFKSASVFEDRLYLCTTTEILTYSLRDWSQTGYITLPCFNDVHHVTRSPTGTLVVANSGLDMVLELTQCGEVLQAWDTMGRRPWQRFSMTTDYRRSNTKPHESHPNYVFFIEDELWVTRFYQKDAISLTQPGRRIDIGIGNPHDGLMSGDFVYFTTTNGHIVRANKKTLKVENIMDLNAVHKHGGPLGWSRGLFVENGKIWVGFSRLRPTKLKENVDWVKHSLKWRLRWLLPERYTKKSGWMKRGLKKELPTRIVCYDFTTRTCLQQINLEQHGVGAVFSILPVNPVLGKTKISSLTSFPPMPDSDALTS